MTTAARLVLLTRLGFAARGLLYIVIAFLILSTGRTEDPAGALAYLAQGGGRLLMIVVTAGLIGYGLWRLADAAFDIERHGNDGKGAAERVGAGASGLIHLVLAWQAIRILRGGELTGGDGATEGAATALSLPGGGMLLMAAGAILAAIGLFQLVKAAKGSFLEHLEPAIAQKPWAKWSGRLGYAARGIVFLISGFFLVGAGSSEQASQAGGMAAALSWLSNPWDIIVAIGLLAFGIFSLIEARYRVLHQMPTGDFGRHIPNPLR